MYIEVCLVKDLGDLRYSAHKTLCGEAAYVILERFQ